MTKDEQWSHTPGPWEARGCELVGFSTLIATLHWHSGRSAENEADALLIQSSPDMLRSLTAIAEADMSKQPRKDGETDYDVALRFILGLKMVAIAAIAKATDPSFQPRIG